MKDKYDEAIDWLVANPTDDSGRESTFEAWFLPHEDTPEFIAKAHCLFQFATPSGGEDGDCGCLTQIRRGGSRTAWTQELTEAIAADSRIPSKAIDLKYLRGDKLRAALQPFAEWQRRLDREIRSPSEVRG